MHFLQVLREAPIETAAIYLDGVKLGAQLFSPPQRDRLCDEDWSHQDNQSSPCSIIVISFLTRSDSKLDPRSSSHPKYEFKCNSSGRVMKWDRISWFPLVNGLWFLSICQRWLGQSWDFPDSSLNWGGPHFSRPPGQNKKLLRFAQSLSNRWTVGLGN
jgi:hypothetical protein